MPSLDDKDEFMTGPQLSAWTALNAFRMWMSSLATWPKDRTRELGSAEQMKHAGEHLIELQDRYDRWMDFFLEGRRHEQA